MLGGSGPRWVGMEILVAYGTEWHRHDLTTGIELPWFSPIEHCACFASDLGVQGPNLTFAEENPALSETIS